MIAHNANDPAAIFRQLIAAREVVSIPGVYDTLSSLLAKRAGFPAVFVSGSAIAASRLARPDVNLLAITEIADVVARIRERLDVPILADADAGYGNAMNVRRTVLLLERAGASGIQIEDQLNHKPSGALTSRPVIELQEMLGKIKAAQDARTNDQTVISARTDAIFTRGFEEALRRGADMVFVEGLTEIGDIRRLTSALGSRIPLVFNILNVGAAPIGTAEEAATRGYRVVLFPAVGIRAAVQALAQDFARLKEGQGPEGGSAITAAALSDVIEASAFLELGARYES